MEVTIENLIQYLERTLTGDEKLSPQSVIRDWDDGISIVYLLEDLADDFNITLEKLNFHQYFLDESELNTMTWKNLFTNKKQREIKEELTVQMLLDYMINNIQSESNKVV